MNEELKTEIVINFMVTLLFILVTAFFFWPKDTKIQQSNAIDTTKTQIKIIVKRLNIREEATIDAKDIGDVYQDEIYTVLEVVEKNDYYWYKINTANNISGYIASDKKEEYVELLSGYIDRTPPIIEGIKDFFISVDNVVNIEDISCTDEYSTCTLTYEIKSLDTITFIAKDEAGNERREDIKYYSVHKDFNVAESNDNITANYKKEKKDGYIEIDSTYILKKSVLSSNKSVQYTPVITFYDSDFKEVRDITVFYNELSFKEECINTKNNVLKDEYLEKDLESNSVLCFNYKFLDSSSISYYFIGFTSVDNYQNKDNYGAFYYSKYYKK